MLNAASALHYWSARYGPVPVVGGKPVFTRNSAGYVNDQRGAPYSAIINTPRFGWDTISSERRQTMLLELAKTNPLLYSSDFSNAAWTKVTTTVTTGIPDPMGGTSACTLTATAATSYAQQLLATSSSIARTGSVWLRRRTGSGTVQVQGPDGSTQPTVTLTSSWQRFSVTGTTSTARYAAVVILTSGDAVDVWNFQIDDSAFSTSDIPTTSAAVTRSADSFYWQYTAPPQAMMAYSRHVERGSQLISASGIYTIGNAAATDPLASVYNSGTYYTAYVNGRSSALAAAPAIGDVVEIVLVLTSGGATQAIQSINGAAVSSSALSAATALPSAWSDTRLWMNSTGTSGLGSTRLAELKLVKYADVAASTSQSIMDELRGYELGPNGDLLSSGS